MQTIMGDKHHVDLGQYFKDQHMGCPTPPFHHNGCVHKTLHEFISILSFIVKT
jgi:hypothetical protein